MKMAERPTDDVTVTPLPSDETILVEAQRLLHGLCLDTESPVTAHADTVSVAFTMLPTSTDAASTDLLLTLTVVSGWQVDFGRMRLVLASEDSEGIARIHGFEKVSSTQFRAEGIPSGEYRVRCFVRDLKLSSQPLTEAVRGEYATDFGVAMQAKGQPGPVQLPLDQSKALRAGNFVLAVKRTRSGMTCTVQPIDTPSVGWWLLVLAAETDEILAASAVEFGASIPLNVSGDFRLALVATEDRSADS